MSLIDHVQERALPWPDQPWYRFEIEPIATTLRPEDEAQGITSDMCIPIFPNTNHPNGRESLQPSPEGLFPYDSCYHWFQPKLVDVRIRARPELFDETNAVSVSVRTRIRTLMRLFLHARHPPLDFLCSLRGTNGFS